MSVPASMPCAACGGQARLALVADDTNRRIGSARFPYYHCPACGWWFLAPIPADLGAYYPQDYHAIPRTRDDLAKVAVNDRYKVGLVAKHCPGGRLLEVGPSYGMFLLLAQQAGYAVEGIEMDAGCCAFLASLGFTVQRSDDPAQALRSLAPYDAIALWHVFEHLPRPWEVLPALAGALKPGGILVLALPNPASLQFRLLGRRWTHLDAPRHLHLVPPLLLAKHAAACGLELVECGGNDAGGLGWNRFGWVHSLRNLASWPPLRVALHATARLLELAAMPLERTGNRGATYTAIFRKTA
jgi:2-polyprenyl-3-methyl-5-hydroxy-6-metoxy-1,4-benzoquinol methylase